MLRKYLLPVLALCGMIIGLTVIFWSEREVPVPPILFPPPKSPYPHAIAATGIIEASSQNIAIGSPFNEVIAKIFVAAGDKVKIGDPLFQLDLRNFEAQLVSAKASLQFAIANFEDKEKQFSFYKRLQDMRAVSEQLYQQVHYAFLEAQENVRVAQANVNEVEVNIQRSIIRAPIDGEILQVNIRVGEIAPVIPVVSPQSTWMTAAQGTLILMGCLNPLQMRVNVDEDDVWRFEKGAEATAFVRGNSHIHFPMGFVRIEPYVVPKSSFTGDTAERVDTRVLQVLYNFEQKDLPIYSGQVLDVFIKSKPIEEFLK